MYLLNWAQLEGGEVISNKNGMQTIMYWKAIVMEMLTYYIQLKIRNISRVKLTNWWKTSITEQKHVNISEAKIATKTSKSKF